MIRIIVFLSLMLCVDVPTPAQKHPVKTTRITISGNIQFTRSIAIDDLRKFKRYEVGDVQITNHAGELKGIARSLSGVLLKDILASLPLTTDNPKLFSEYYFVCKGSDGYKVVFSWNELFNTATGNSVYIVTEKDDKPIDETDESMLMISAHDVRTGRRYVKNLETIYVGRVE